MNKINTAIKTRKSTKEIKINNEKMGRFKIQFKLIGVFLIPVLFLILLGVISYLKASNALINNYKTSTLSNMNNMTSYFDLGLKMVSDKATLLNTNSILKNYYSGEYSDNVLNEQKKYKELQGVVFANILSDSIINNIYIFGDYGNGILTDGTPKNTLYGDFKDKGEGAAFVASGNKNQWMGSHPLLDQETSVDNDNYSLSYISYIYNSTNEKAGFVVLDVSIDFIKEALKKSGLPKESKVAFISKDGKEISRDAKSDSKVIYGKDYYNLMIKKNAGTNGFSEITENHQKYLYLYSYVPQCDSYLCVLIPQKVITKQANSVGSITVIVVIIASIIAILFGTMISYGISNTIKKINQILEKSASGDLTHQVSMKRRDEFLLLGNGINKLMESIKDLIRDMSKVSNTMLASSAEVSDSSNILFHTTQNISSAVEDVMHGITSQSQGTESCLLQMSDLAVQIEKLSDNTTQIRKSADNTRVVIIKGLSIVNDLGLRTQQSSEMVSSVITNIENLEQQSKAISDILKGVNEISEQTNLLSLNASIEAARAGNEGKGFQVVANEIRKLAERSSKESERIGAIINQIQSQTQLTVKTAKSAEGEEKLREAALQNAISAFSDIDHNVEHLTNVLDNIMNGLKEIENAKDDTLGAVEEISAISEQTTAAMDQLSTTANEQLKAVEALYQAVEEMEQDSNILGTKINVFKTN